MCRACRLMDESRRQMGTGFADPISPSSDSNSSATAATLRAQPVMMEQATAGSHGAQNNHSDGDPLMTVDNALFGYSPRQTTMLRASWGLLLLVLIVLALLGVGDYLVGKYAYAAERSRINVHNEELDALESVSRSFRSVAAVAKPGVVHIRVPSDNISEEEWSEWQRDLRERFPNIPDGRLREFLEPDNSGSGVIFDENGLILTNSHVVGEQDVVHVRLADDRTFSGRVMGRDTKTDLAVVRINAPNLHALKFGDSDELMVGDWVLAVGAPFGLAYTVTHGIVSALDRNQIDGVNITYQDFIQTDASINPGNSGGPLLNLRGEVIGINTAIATRGGSGNAGIAFTIPSNQAVRVARQLVSSGKVVRGWLGISMDELVEGDSEVFGLRGKGGVLVNLVLPDTPASTAGLAFEDVIVAIDDEPVTKIPQIQQYIANISPGTSIDIDVVRYGQPKRIRLKLGEQPDDMRARGEVAHEIDALNLVVRTLRSVSAESIGLPSTTRGVVVQNALSEASKQSFAPLDVIVGVDDKPLANVGDLRDVLKSHRSSGRLKLEIISADGESRIVYYNPKR
jgi:serine protease Do